MDTAKVGVAGHSYGALTTMLVTGATSFKSNPPIRMADPRIKAAIAMSPQGIGEPYGLTAESWRDVKVPMLFMTGTNDRGIAGHEDPAWRHDPFQYSPAGDKYFISFEGARHITFTGGLGIFDVEDIQTTGPNYVPMQATDIYGNPVMVQQRVPGGADVHERDYLRERNIFAAVRAASLAFWDTYLKGDAKAKEFMTTDQLAHLNGSHVTVERK
jgi:predicted dienelactone hydrolase